MAGRIRPDDVTAVRERSDIVQVVSSHLQLRKAGRDSMVGLCPFHTEKTASFSVSPTKQVYYCFGCGEGGDVFKFLEEVENLSFGEAVEKLAAAVGVTLRYEGESASDRRVSGHRQAIHRAIGEAARLYVRMLMEGREGAEARAYVRSRGISPESVERFAIGYAPGYPDFLLKRLTKTYSPELLIEAGLVMKDAGGTLRDRFRGRVTFPLHDLSGNAVGFGGRLLAGPHAPPNAAKYVNSPETAVYRKGNLLYNLNRAKAEVTRSGRAFLVEGYTDVVALDQAGIGSAVATCGTALGEEHVRLLSRFAERLVLAFDSDEAGARAAERAHQFHQSYPVDISVMVLPEGQDPADFVQARGGDAGQAFEVLAKEAVPLVEYMIGRSLRDRDLSDLEQRARATREGLVLVAGLEDPVRRQEYARVLAGKVGEPEISVMLQLERMLSGELTGPAEPDREGVRVPPHVKVEREALKILLQAPEMCQQHRLELTPERFSMASHRAAFELLSEGHRAGWSAAELVATAHDRSRGEQMSKLLANLAMDPPTTVGEVTQEYADQIFLRLEEFALKRRSEEIRKRLEKLNPVTSVDEYESLYTEFVRLEGARRRIRVAAEESGGSPL